MNFARSSLIYVAQFGRWILWRTDACDHAFHWGMEVQFYHTFCNVCYIDFGTCVADDTHQTSTVSPPKFKPCPTVTMAGIDQSVKRLATGWTVRGSNPGEAEIFFKRPDRPWGPPNLLYNGYRAFARGKAAEAWFWPPTPSSAEVRKEYNYTSTPHLWALRGLLHGTFTFLPTMTPRVVSRCSINLYWMYAIICKQFASRMLQIACQLQDSRVDIDGNE
jgi:hypothetical protein